MVSKKMLLWQHLEYLGGSILKSYILLYEVERETANLFATVAIQTRRSSKCSISSASTALLGGLPA